jgi:uncharacterized protein
MAERPAIIASMTDDGHARRTLVQEQRARIVDFLAARGARNVRLFGSLARGEDDPQSDIDLLVELEGDRSPGMELMMVLGLSEELSELLATRVDVVTIRVLRPELTEVALAEAVPLWPAARTSAPATSSGRSRLIREHLAGGEFDRKTSDAILYNLVVIGEAAARIGEDTRARAPDIPWTSIVGLRNLVTHEYFRVDLDIVEDIVATSLGPLETEVKRLPLET